MKKMNNYEAPVAEVIELNVNNDMMQTRFGWDTPEVGTSSESGY